MMAPFLITSRQGLHNMLSRLLFPALGGPIIAMWTPPLSLSPLRPSSKCFLISSHKPITSHLTAKQANKRRNASMFTFSNKALFDIFILSKVNNSFHMGNQLNTHHNDVHDRHHAAKSYILVLKPFSSSHTASQGLPKSDIFMNITTCSGQTDSPPFA